MLISFVTSFIVHPVTVVKPNRPHPKVSEIRSYSQRPPRPPRVDRDPDIKADTELLAHNIVSRLDSNLITIAKIDLHPFI